eukprot:NODE_1891_length_818_cov_204.475943_g1492_i0.p5 GENE.NODE_1891_length_818_cov_204.475943_g1492_i0~~NODE_1891_length_818_cov_204.475943_g1492_i0.p5  ORF type:complete len:53 (-),score=9.21 NODE_1891_length_818_cov_204.475943_g1492_i0:279-437(-)
MVTPARSLLISSSFLIAKVKNLGLMRFFLLSLAALAANSSTSAHKYSKTAAK